MSISISYDPTEWRSSDRSSEYKPTRKLVAGVIIVVKREPYRIHEITPRPHINWPEEYLDAWERAGRPDPEDWWHRPFVLILGKEDAPESKQRWHVVAVGSRFWTVLPEHYAVCRLCGELPPCRHEHTETVMEHATAQMAEAMAILPGFCHHCKEPITRRQGSVRFEGENLIRPDLGNNSAIFHTRATGGCFDAAYGYDKRWAVAESGRRGKLSCMGSAVHHVDGTVECSLGDECAGATDVLGEAMRHRGGDARHHPAWSDRGGRVMPATNCWCTVAQVDSAVATQPSTPNGA